MAFPFHYARGAYNSIHYNYLPFQYRFGTMQPYGEMR